MRRTISSLLMIATAAILFLPLASAFSRNNLPECCRRDGRHHCGMAKRDGFLAGQPSCPFHRAPFVRTATAAAVSQVQVHLVLNLVSVSLVPWTQKPANFCVVSCLERGPPVSSTV